MFKIMLIYTVKYNCMKINFKNYTSPTKLFVI